MADVFSKFKRSQVMSHVRGRANKTTELEAIKFFRRHGISGWRRHQPVFGRPDFVFPKAGVAVFVDGCFWHGCPKHSTVPATHRAFWKRKLTANKLRDRLVNRTLRRKGWRVARIWEHELARKNEKRLVRRIESAIKIGVGRALRCPPRRARSARPTFRTDYLRDLREMV
jgi:DNA mismatch endonuclease (patch repair protein)